MRVLVVSDADIGGAETVVLAQVRELERQGVKKRLFVPHELSKFSERFRNWRSVYRPMGLALFSAQILDFKPDIVHFDNNQWKLGIACVKIAKESGAKVFFTAHDTGLFYPHKYFGRASFWHQLRTQRLRFNPLRNLLIKKYVRYVDRIFAVSDALGQALREHGFENTTLHNGINVTEWAQPEPSAHAPTVLFAGRISGAKGASVLPAIEALVCAKVPNIKFLIVGKDLWVPREKMPEVYANTDVVIVPSVYLDPFPTVVLEAGASARPVVVTNLGGAKEAVTDDVTGLVADPHSPLFAERIVELLSNPARAREMGECARAHITRNFSLEKQVAKLIQYYNG